MCGKIFPSSKLKQHTELSHLLPPDFSVPCPVCDVSVKFLPFHLNKFHKQLDIRRDCFPCRRCCRYFTSLADLTAHEADHCVYTCYSCDAKFERFISLGWHYLQEHNKVFNLSSRGRVKQGGAVLSSLQLSKSKLFTFKPIVDTEPFGSDSEEEEDSVEKFSVEVNCDGTVTVEQVVLETQYMSDEDEEIVGCPPLGVGQVESCDIANTSSLDLRVQLLTDKSDDSFARDDNTLSREALTASQLVTAQPTAEPVQVNTGELSNNEEDCRNRTQSASVAPGQDHRVGNPVHVAVSVSQEEINSMRRVQQLSILFITLS